MVVTLRVQNCRQKSNSVQSFLWPFLLTAKQAKSLVIILLNSSRSITNQCQIFILVANRRGQWCWLIKISSSALKKMLFKPLHFFQCRKFFWVPNWIIFTPEHLFQPDKSIFSHYYCFDHTLTGTCLSFILQKLRTYSLSTRSY